MENNLNSFLAQLHKSVNDKEFRKLILSAPKNKTSELKKITIIPVELKRGFFLNFVFRYTTKDITKNYETDEALLKIESAIKDEFNNAELILTSTIVNLYSLANAKFRIKTSSQIIEAPLLVSHDKMKEKPILISNNIYLRELEVTNKNFELRREMSDKFRQINRYIELISPYLHKLQDNLRIVDMGSGKGYLTFALYDYLFNTLQLQPEITGVEFREDLVNKCNEIAQKSAFEKLHFEKGSIKDTVIGQIDVLIALHACNTATDDAIFRGITSDAKLIVCSPCCHKQIRQDMQPTGDLTAITRFGILKERQAEIITDTIRALILEYFGYKTQVFEFIPVEHTPKNVMIVGLKSSNENPDRNKIQKQIQSIKQAFGIEKHYLETLFSL